MDYQCTQPSEEIDKIIQRTQERGIEICRQNEELNRVHEETMQILRELIKVQDEKRIAIEKEAAELEAKRKSQECLNIEEKSIPQASIRSRKSRIDPTLRNFTISTKRSLESRVKDPIPIPSESDVISNGDCDDYQKRSSAITPDLPIPDSLIMEDEHLDTIPVTESANTIKSSVEDLVPTPSESADLSDGESECDLMMISLSKRNSKGMNLIFLNPLYDLDDEIITNEKNSSYSKDLDVVIPIPPGIEEQSNSEISDATIESLSPSPILIEDSDSLMEEINLFLASDRTPPFGCHGLRSSTHARKGNIRFL
ncbi:hypothetical protein Tco_0006108 [Tanacetum coccineum]